MAAIGRLPDTLADRCILIRMQRKLPHEKCDRLKNLDTAELRRRCARFALDHQDPIAAVAPELPAALHDRAADVWEPLLVLADLSGGPWPERARQAATALTAGAGEHSTVGSLLLDIMICFYETKADRLLSRQLVKDLNRLGERPWSDLSGCKPITELWLAQRLRPYGVRPTVIRFGDNLGRGYVRDDFQDMFKRYVSFAEIQAHFGSPETKPPLPPPTQTLTA
jgi:putative DNA primase/helicase